MTSVICTLFEKHYHYGVAALGNSLYKQGFRGEIFCGYRGHLPTWAAGAKANSKLSWSGARTLALTEGLQLHFLPIETEYHLTNYKPDFMLKLWDGPAQDAAGIFYFDPDIVVTAPWSFFNEWINYGVALCEDVNSPLAQFHPRRVAWRRYFQKHDIRLNFKDSIYNNGGFIGVNRKDQNFLSTWKLIQEAMAPAIGGLNRSSLTGEKLPLEFRSAFSAFSKTDQDALNATVEVWEGEVSSVGKEGMAFCSGASIMPHALGLPKPWQRNALFEGITGKPPRKVDREYWNSANGTIKSQPTMVILRNKIAIQIAALTGRFYRSVTG